MTVKVHVKNNRWAAGSFPNTPEGEAVFTITQDRIDSALADFPDLAGKMDFRIDWDTDNFETSMGDTDVLLTWNLPTKGLGAIAPKLRWVHCIGAGVEHLLPLDWLPKGVTLTNSKGIHAAKAGEFGLMAVLMLHSHMPKIITNQRKVIYDSLYASPIAGKTLVVLGTGSLGGAGAKKVQALGVHVIGVNRSGRAVDGCDEVVTTAELDKVLPRADYLLIATPDTPETRGLMDRRRLDLMKPSAGLINIGREAVMDYDALCDKLEEGSLAGAILDVFDPEPIEADSRLWATPNLIITPHVSADDGDAYVPMTLGLFFLNMREFLKGKPLLNPIQPDLGY
ncbi:Phosphoglycerate dehydrogenase [Roseovarius tolerans]|uniref:Phosphoglycerate dehydrogenase n=1 Tax=Roseovarius tolerans TaxID=74031 RepID=A0A1H8IEQ1_9RHOB|nr:D-2-hydroxyacid dehydrogenase [Roseovarius tolerans]SEN66729.1 Phosphoglycerate dehydrogenase [Roseovarius tolerans]